MRYGEKGGICAFSLTHWVGVVTLCDMGKEEEKHCIPEKPVQLKVEKLLREMSEC